jgi:hypothetical protein
LFVISLGNLDPIAGNGFNTPPVVANPDAVAETNNKDEG